MTFTNLYFLLLPAKLRGGVIAGRGEGERKKKKRGRNLKGGGEKGRKERKKGKKGGRSWAFAFAVCTFHPTRNRANLNGKRKKEEKKHP